MRPSSRHPRASSIPELGGDGLVATEVEPQRLVTVYVDTADLRIVRWGSSLRHRQGEGEKVWTVKLPSSGNGSQLVRTEVNFEGADARKLPTAAADLVRALVRGEELAPVARLQTVRRGVRISDDAGTPLAIVTDDEVSVMDGRRVASRFRELEVELDPAGRCGALGGPRRAPQGGRRRSRRQRPQARPRARPARRGPARPRGPRARRARGRDRGGPTGARDVGGAAAPPRRRGSAGRGSRRGAPGEGGHAARALGAPDVPRRARAGVGGLAARPAPVAGRRARRRARHRGPARPDPLEGADAARGRPQGARGARDDGGDDAGRDARAAAGGDPRAGVRGAARRAGRGGPRTAGPRGGGRPRRRRPPCDPPSSGPGSI